VGCTGPDDPLLVANLRAVLRRWHSAALGDADLATHLTAVEGHLAAEPHLSRALALQGVIRAALATCAGVAKPSSLSCWSSVTSTAGAHIAFARTVTSASGASTTG